MMTSFRRRNLRVSLTMWYVGAIIVVLSSYAFAVYAFVSRNASNALDDRLRDDFQWAAAMADQQADGTLKWFDGDGISEENSPWLTVWSDGRIVFRSAVAERNPLPETDALINLADQRIIAVPMATSVVRVLKGRTTIYGRTVVLEVVRSEASMRRQLRELALLLLLGLPLGVAVAGVGGYLLARRALAPIERMAAYARAITAERLSERLPVNNPDDELGRLATVFNTTLGRLESSFTHMRRFAADVSHQLRTPLTAIRAVGEVALRERRDARTYRGVISSMLEEIDRLGHVVNQLLTMSRSEMGQSRMSREPIDLHDLADDVVTQLSVLAEEKQQSLTADSQGSPWGFADRLAVRQSLMNLVDNAIKYTPSGGQIRLRVWESPTSAVIEVCDNGPGIAPDAQRRIFDRFERAGGAAEPGDVGGFGLGLSIAKWAVEANGGQLRLEQTQGGGSTFRISLALAASATLEIHRRTA
jgi:heavy metal sensor kinase